MSALQLYNYWRSSASYRVRIALALKGLPYQYLPIHLLKEGGQQFSAAYRELNPQSRVPTLVANGKHLTQSMAIIEWLEETYPQPALLPSDALARARVRSLAQILVADVQPLQNVAVTRYLTEVLQLDKAAVKAWMFEWMQRGMSAFEAGLHSVATGNYCHGDTPTLADTCLVPQMYSARRFGLNLEQFPHMLRIEANCQALAAFQNAAPELQPDAEL